MSTNLKVHVALNTPAFDASVAFYRAFLGIEPVKLKPGYAKFDVAEPPPQPDAERRPGAHARRSLPSWHPGLLDRGRACRH